MPASRNSFVRSHSPVLQGGVGNNLQFRRTILKFDKDHEFSARKRQCCKCVQLSMMYELRELCAVSGRFVTIG